MSERPRIGVVGATGAVGTVTLALLAERGYEDVRAFASERSAGSRVPFGERELVVEEATPQALGAGDVDLFLFHQANLRINEFVAQQLEIPAEKCLNNIDRYGNCSAASIPMLLDECNDAVDNVRFRRKRRTVASEHLEQRSAMHEKKVSGAGCRVSALATPDTQHRTPLYHA